MRVTQNKCSRTSTLRDSCATPIRAGMTKQSTRNWKSWGCSRAVRKIYSFYFWDINFSAVSGRKITRLVDCKSPQSAKMCLRSSTDSNSLQWGVWQYSYPERDQTLARASVLLRPDILVRRTFAMVSKYGDEPAEVITGWGLVRLYNSGWTNSSERRLSFLS